jgi:predicted DNA-binding transcriptional regulator YafY
MNRALRLKTMEMLYMERAYTDQEMADELGVRRETAYQDRIELETEGEIPFVEIEHGRRKIDRTQYLPHIKVNLHEALALYLSMRRASRQTRTAQPHVQRALEKLALALKQPWRNVIRVAAQVAQQLLIPIVKVEDLAGAGLCAKGHYEALTGVLKRCI